MQVASIGLAAAVTEIFVVWVRGDLVRTREQLVEDLTDLVVASIAGTNEIVQRRAARAQAPKTLTAPK